MTAVIYARYSSDNQREESIEGQIRECTAYAEKNDITIVKHYIDRAISAKTDNRPQFQQMIKDSDKKLFDIVLVWKLDRFARNRYDSARYKTQLKKNGVKLMSATEIISEGPEGIILESVLEGYAEYYSADLAEKVVRGQTENILKGRCNGGRGTFGYTLDSERKFHIDPLASPFVLESFTKYRDGLTMKEIRDWLNENGIKNPVGGEFTYNSVEHMLKNRRYIGELKFRDVVVPDAIPPIVPLELFDDVQEKIAKNKKAPARRKAEDDYLLTTKLHCGCCGALMFGESGTSRTGEVHRYYKCATAKKKKGCKKKTVRKQWLEDLVVNQTMQLVKDDAAMESIIAKVMELQNKENTNIPLYEKQLRDAESGIQNMLNAIQAGILTSSTKERLEQLEETKRELEARIAEEKLAKPKVTEEFIRFWLLRFRKLNMNQKDQRQALVDTFINSIYLYDDKVLITFNYKEGTQTVTFGEATEVASEGNGSDLDCIPAPTHLRALPSGGSVLSRRRPKEDLMVYTIGEMAKMLGVPASTLRYYDKEGLLPFVARSSGGIRQFRESDIEWLRVIGCMKKAGMSIKDIRQYLELSMQGNNTIDTRLAMFRHQREVLQAQMDELQHTLRMVEYKCWYYETAQAAGTVEVLRDMPEDKVPEQFRAIRQELKQQPEG